jgi:hypothetical protein
MTQIICTTNSKSIEELYRKRELYRRSYPSCQRNYVWEDWKKKRFIDTILRNLPIPPITIIPEHDELLGETPWVVDGQQRVETIYRFMDGEFPTAKNFSNEREIHPIEPNTYYHHLSPARRAAFDLYDLQVTRVQNVSVEQIGIVYRRLQYQSPLTFAERLYSYDGQTKDLAIMLEHHPFWSVIYSGDTKRKQVFKAGVYIVMMEHAGIFVNTTTPRLVDAALLKNNKWHFTPKDIEKRLDLATRVFQGASINAMAQFIPVYQSIMLLQEAGYDLKDSPFGCLAGWLMEVRAEGVGKRDFFSSLSQYGKQRDFWSEQFPKITEAVKEVKRDPKRFFDEKAKIDAWLRQEGRCAKCTKNLRFQDGIAHHEVGHTNGGETTAQNLLLLHPRCHQELHGIEANSNLQTQLSSA